MNEDLDDHEYAGQVHSGHRLEEGILYHYPGSRRSWDFLLPLCSADGLDDEAMPLRFMVRDGHVWFSRRP